jgi:hypothetical protein
VRQRPLLSSRLLKRVLVLAAVVVNAVGLIRTSVSRARDVRLHQRVSGARH